MRYYSRIKICEQLYFLRSYENSYVLANLETDLKKKPSS